MTLDVDKMGQRTFLKDRSGDHKREFLQGFHILVPSTEDTDLGQTNHQGPRHGGLAVVPAADGSGNVSTDDGAR